MMQYALMALTALATVAAAGMTVALFNAQKARQRVSTELEQLQADADALREEFASIAGWQPDGTLPEDWAERVRAELTSQQHDAAEARLPDLEAAVMALRRLGPPEVLADHTGSALVEEHHDRLVATVEGLARAHSDIRATFVNGGLDRLYAMAARLSAYFPQARQTVSYELVAAVITEHLDQLGITVLRPAPLAFTAEDTVEVDRHGRELISDHEAIAQWVRWHSAKLSLTDERYCFVLDLVSPGWEDGESVKAPLVRVWDRSWT